MKGRSLQLRSVIAAALGILISLVIVGAATSVLVSRHLHRSLDQTLRQRAVQIAQLNASAPALVTTPGALDSPVGGTQLIVEVVDAHGRIVAHDPGEATQDSLTAGIAAARSSRNTPGT